MKFVVNVCFLLAGHVVTTLAAIPRPGENFLDGRAQLRADAKVDAVAVCGSLGVNDEIPEGADRSQYGLCKDHPLGHTIPTFTSTNETVVVPANETELANLEKRACWHGRAHGCSRGYCWRRCGSDWNRGYWCWMSTGQDNHVWVVCSVDGQCAGWEPRPCSGGCSC